MKLLSFFLIIILLCNCAGNTKNFEVQNTDSFLDTLKIVNDTLEYEIIILEPGFNGWLISNARSRGFHTQIFFETRNRVWISEYNNRHRQPFSFDPNLYPLHIEYDANTNYGYDVNYLLYHYLVYFQLKYNQKLGGFVPRT
jgi:hypothetical protein